MITDEYTDYIVAVIKLVDKDEIERLPGELKIIIDRRDIPSKEYLIATLHNFLETSYLRNTWIRDDVYRFLAFIYRETQISRIADRVEKIKDPVAIILLRKGGEEELKKYSDRIITLESSLAGIEELAIFRLNLERERGRNLKIQ